MHDTRAAANAAKSQAAGTHHRNRHWQSQLATARMARCATMTAACRRRFEIEISCARLAAACPLFVFERIAICSIHEMMDLVPSRRPRLGPAPPPSDSRALIGEQLKPQKEPLSGSCVSASLVAQPLTFHDQRLFLLHVHLSLAGKHAARSRVSTNLKIMIPAVLVYEAGSVELSYLPAAECRAGGRLATTLRPFRTGRSAQLRWDVRRKHICPTRKQIACFIQNKI